MIDTVTRNRRLQWCFTRVCFASTWSLVMLTILGGQLLTMVWQFCLLEIAALLHLFETGNVKCKELARSIVFMKAFHFGPNCHVVPCCAMRCPVSLFWRGFPSIISYQTNVPFLPIATGCPTN